MDRHVRQLLAELELISHGSVQAWNSAGGHGEPTTVLPFGESNPPHLVLRALYLGQHTDAGRASVVATMVAELRSVRGHVDRSHVVGESRESEDARIVMQGEGFTADEVARLFKCTPSRVRRVRLAADRSVELGKPLPLVVSVGTDQRRVKAREYHGQGMTLTQIGRLLGCDKATVSRDLRAA